MHGQYGVLKRSTTGRGIAFCLCTMFLFAVQDAITKVLVQDMHVAQFVMVRYWVFAVFALLWVGWRGGVFNTLRSSRPGLQITRSILSVAEIAIFNLSLRYLGLSEAHALLAMFPLITIALAAPMLGERIGMLRWVAVGVGFIGTLIILRPGFEVFKPESLIALSAAFCFALYNIITRQVSAAGDGFKTNMLYMALIGCLCATTFGVPVWRDPTSEEWWLLSVLSVIGIIAHLLLVKALEYAPASVLQPFNYSLLVFATLIGLIVFAELPDIWTMVGSAVVIGSGLYVIYKGDGKGSEHQKS